MKSILRTNNVLESLNPTKVVNKPVITRIKFLWTNLIVDFFMQKYCKVRAKKFEQHKALFPLFQNVSLMKYGTIVNRVKNFGAMSTLPISVCRIMDFAKNQDVIVNTSMCGTPTIHVSKYTIVVDLGFELVNQYCLQTLSFICFL